MEIEKITSAVASAQNIAGAVQSSGAQNPQIEELQRLADSIRKIENDCRITARVQGLTATTLQMKLRQYDDLLSKIDEQIRDLQKQNRFSAPERVGVSMLQLNTDATQVALRTSGQGIGAAVSEQRQSSVSQAQVSEAEHRAAEQTAALRAAQQAVAEKAAARRGGDRTAPAGSINVLI